LPIYLSIVSLAHRTELQSATMEKKQLPIIHPQVETAAPSYTPAASSPFAILVIAKSDRIRLFSFPRTIIDAVQQIIQELWPRGIQKVQEFNGSHEFKLCGRPWGSNIDEETLATRLLSRILAMLHSQRWVLDITTDISKRMDTRDALIFRHQQSLSESYNWTSINFNGSDQLLIIDAPSDLIQALTNGLSLITKSHKPHKLQDVYELRLSANQWGVLPDDTIPMQSWKFALKLTELLASHGFRVYGSIHQKASASAFESSTWHCCRRRGWVSGAPVS